MKKVRATDIQGKERRKDMNTQTEKEQLALEMAGYIRAKKLYIEPTPNGKWFCVLYNVGPLGDKMLLCLKQLFGEPEGCHVNEEHGSCAILFPSTKVPTGERDMTATAQTSISQLKEALIAGHEEGKFQEPLALKVEDDTFCDCGVKFGDSLIWDPSKQALYHGRWLKH